MAKYQLYFLDVYERVASARFLECADDDAACRVATTYITKQPVELWQEIRFVQRFDTVRN